MRFLKYLLIALIAIIVILVILGLANPTLSYGHKISTDKSVEESWAVMQDVSKYDQWLAGFQSMELISGEKNEVGSKYKVIVKPSEAEPNFEMIETLVSIKEFDHIELHFDSEMMDFEQTTSFTQSDGQTHIETKSAVAGKGLIMKSMFAAMHVLGGTFQKQEESNINNLKKLIESNTTNYFPVIETLDDAEVIVQ